MAMARKRLNRRAERAKVELRTFDTTAPLCDSQGNITSVVEKDATNCSGKTEVKFYKLVGGIHTWYTTPMNVADQAPFNPDFNSATGITTSEILGSFSPLIPNCER